jgi:hypothetical protein
VGERFLRNPPSVAQQHNALFNECLAAQLVGYGTNGVPLTPPPTSSMEPLKLSAIRVRPA